MVVDELWSGCEESCPERFDLRSESCEVRSTKLQVNNKLRIG